MRTTVKMVLCGVLLAAALFSFSAFTSAPSAHAATTGHAVRLQPATTTCYGQAFKIGSYVIASDLTYFAIDHTFIASPYCNDINIKVTQQAGPTQARVVFLDKTTGAIKGYGSWKNITSVNTWYVLASNVLDTTHFTYEFKVPYPGTTFTVYQAS
ncbi:hypothetical protein [Ktedonobacter racemifer]|uniref:Secreted protein n=1 Tax=Ktedonobacter racemifer DSM 44963 TaxID=485913 RepID=D6TBW7_KTERA|nr:hypothetical protein [Ktedonobacter racemifer]EFH89899.1 conserved hypothetical protein [Ktedonobacter racemifer DSM 44963]